MKQGKSQNKDNWKSPQECSLDLPEQLKEVWVAVLVQCFYQINTSQTHFWNVGSD